jgi:hypothetical protein
MSDWNAFRTKMKGKGYTQAQLSSMYKKKWTLKKSPNGSSKKSPKNKEKLTKAQAKKLFQKATKQHLIWYIKDVGGGNAHKQMSKESLVFDAMAVFDESGIPSYATQFGVTTNRQRTKKSPKKGKKKAKSSCSSRYRECISRKSSH